MIDINYYRKIQNAYGATSLRDAKTQQIKMDLNNDFDKPLDCFTVLVDGVAKDLTIIETNNLDEKKIKARPNTSFKSGQVVEWMDWYWLITKVNRRNDIVTNGKMKECTYHLYWQNESGVIIDKWAFVANASSYSNGETGNATITLSSNQFLVVMPKDEDTINLRDTRMFIDNCTNDKPTPYKLTRPDNVSADYGIGNTYYIFTLDQRNDEKDKKVTLEDGTIVWIADYTTPTTPSQPKNGNETVDLFAHITYAGSNNIRIGGNGKTFTASLTDANDAEKTMTAIWTITPNDYVITSQDGNSLLVKCDDEDLDGETITISVTDEHSGFTTSVEITLSVF